MFINVKIFIFTLRNYRYFTHFSIEKFSFGTTRPSESHSAVNLVHIFIPQESTGRIYGRNIHITNVRNVRANSSNAKHIAEIVLLVRDRYDKLRFYFVATAINFYYAPAYLFSQRKHELYFSVSPYHKYLV